MEAIPRTLSIAGSDSGGGAGIQADLKTFCAFDTYGMSAITALTAQNTIGVQDIYPVDADFVQKQIDSVVSDIGVDAAKTGMLADAEIVMTVADAATQWNISPLVVDPVMVSQSGDRLLHSDAVEAVRRHLLPAATVITPNLPEAEVLLDTTIGDGQMAEAAAELLQMGPRAVIVKGGHSANVPGQQVMDILCDGRGITRLVGDYIDTQNTHGTGCTFSAALAAALARGMDLRSAARAAKHFVTEAIRHSLPLGQGHGPTNHLVRPDLSSGGESDEHGG